MRAYPDSDLEAYLSKGWLPDGWLNLTLPAGFYAGSGGFDVGSGAAG